MGERGSIAPDTIGLARVDHDGGWMLYALRFFRGDTSEHLTLVRLGGLDDPLIRHLAFPAVFGVRSGALLPPSGAPSATEFGDPPL